MRQEYRPKRRTKITKLFFKVYNVKKNLKGLVNRIIYKSNIYTGHTRPLADLRDRTDMQQNYD